MFNLILTCTEINLLMIYIFQGARTGAFRAEKEGTQTRDISYEGGWII